MANQTLPPKLAHFDRLPDDAIVDVKVFAALRGRSVSSTWRDVRAGRIPDPVRVGPMSPRWSVGTIRRHLAPLSDRV